MKVEEPSAKLSFCCNAHTLTADGSSLLNVSLSDTLSSRVRHPRAKCAHFATKLSFAEGSHGYTLIEVIIVVTIIAIFVGVFMFFSGDFVLRARLDVSANTVLAAFSDVQEEVKNGVRVSSDDPVAKCFGLKLQADGVFRVFALYDPALDVSCDIFSYSVSGEILLDEHIYFRDFMFGSDVLTLPLVVLYEPPHGEIRIFANMGSDMVLVDKNVSFLVSYGQEGNLFKKIEVDVAIGRASFLQ